MADTETLAVVVALFSLNYAGIWMMLKQMGKFDKTLSILCREHSINHGKKELIVND